MTTAKHLCVIISIACFPMVAHAQLFAGDSRFPLLNEIRWDMKADDIISLCENRKALVRATDSTIIVQAKLFEGSTKAKIQLDRTSQLPRMIDVAFEEPTSAIRDTLIKHFTRSLGKPPLVTTKEKSAIIFTIRMEVASWRSEKEMINVMAMMRGSTVLGLSILLTKATVVPKS